MLREHLARLDPARRAPFVAATLALLEEPVTVDYVRLNVDAVADER